jgi:hypothetical protein
VILIFFSLKNSKNSVALEALEIQLEKYGYDTSTTPNLHGAFSSRQGKEETVGRRQESDEDQDINSQVSDNGYEEDEVGKAGVYDEGEEVDPVRSHVASPVKKFNQSDNKSTQEM